VKLEQNYRSTSSILNLANDIIKNNKHRHAKELWTKNDGNDLPKLISHDNEYEEARYIAEEIDDLAKKNKALYQNFVVLYRTNSQSRVLEQSFTKMQIPYVVVGGINFYQRAEIKDMISWLRVLTNPQDNESLLRVINLPPRGLGKTTIGQLIDIAIINNKSLFDTISNPDLLISVSKRQNATLISLSERLSHWMQMSGNNPITEIIKDIIEQFSLEEYYTSSDEAKEMTKVENIREFISAASEFTEKYYEENQTFPRISEFLQHISLQTDLDSAEKRAERDAVRLMTMHNAKGLEFDYVFISGLEHGLIPHTFSMGSKEELEEERRLLYVAVTRAKKLLFLNYCHSRRFGDSYQYSKPSEFLNEINIELFDEVKASFWERHAPKKENYKPNIKPEMKKITENDKFFKIGQKILHQSFGSGVILSIEGCDRDAKLTISFNSGLMKKIIGTWVEIIDEKD
jgi:DNA helicase-2/ATP-dependent DNA helicase PcrA